MINRTLEDNGIIHACTVDGDGSGRSLSGAAIAKAIEDDKLAWVHLDVNDPESRKWLESELTYLDQIIIDALLAEETRPRVVEFEKGILLILRGVNLNANADPDDMVSIRMWVDKHRIISIQRRPLKAADDIRQRLKDGKGPKNSGDFVVMLSARLFEHMGAVFAEMDDALDEIEEKIIDDPDQEHRQAITEIRKQAIVFRRYISPQRDAISALRTTEHRWIDQTQRRKLQETLDRVIRYTEDLDALRERSQVMKDELSHTLADKTNKNTYMLSVMSSIFLPLTFLTGLLGINVAGIPSADNPSAFFIFCVLLMTVVTIQIILFKALKWF